MAVNWRNVQGEHYLEKRRLRKTQLALQSADMRKCSKIRVFALLLFVLPAGMLSGVNTEKKEELRAAVEHAMEGRAGAAVVADVATGEILAAHELDLAAHRLARPGSTVKPFVLMALLESGKIEASERLLCRRPLRIGGVRMDCSHASSIVELNAEEAIAYSCNSYFAEAATRLSGAELVQALRQSGAGFAERAGEGRGERKDRNAAR